MSVLGFDIGNANSLIAIAQKGGVDLVANEASSLINPSMVAYGEQQRFEGEAAKSQQSTNLRNTIENIKYLIGRRWSSAVLQSELSGLGYQNSFCEDPCGRLGIKVEYLMNPCVFTCEQVYAALLHKLRSITERSSKNRVRDLVISVPSYYDDSQRRAVLDAAVIANLNVLRLINDHMAAAINYGLFKLNLSETEPRRVMIIDTGHLSFTASIFEFTRSQAKALSSVSCNGLGGRGVDYLLANYFAEEFLSKYNVDLRKYPKPWYRLVTAVEKVKKVLNQNPSMVFNVECIYEGRDINSTINRDKFEQLIQPLSDMIPTVLHEALDKAGLKSADLYSVELIGSTSRLYYYQKVITSCLNLNLSFTMNAEEAVVKGAALACAMCSPLIHVRKYDIIDRFMHQINVSWTLDGVEWMDKQMFEYGTQLKNMGIARYLHVSVLGMPSDRQSLELRVSCSQLESDVPIAEATISNIPPGATNVRIKMRINASGILVIESAEAELREEIVESSNNPTSADVNMDGCEDNRQQSPSDSTTSNGNEKMEVDGNANEGVAVTPTPDATKPVEKKFKKTYVPIVLKVFYRNGLSQETLNNYKKIEQNIEDQSMQISNAREARNALEAYIYDVRSLLETTWKDFTKPEELNEISTQLEQNIQLLEEESEYQPITAYEDRLRHLHTLCDPISFRVYEHQNLPSAVRGLRDLIDKFVSRSDQLNDYIPQEDAKKFTNQIKNTREWLDSYLIKQSKLSQTDDSILTTAAVLQRLGELKNVCVPILDNAASQQEAAKKKMQDQSTQANGNKCNEPASSSSSPPDADIPPTEQTIPIPNNSNPKEMQVD